MMPSISTDKFKGPKRILAKPIGMTPSFRLSQQLNDDVWNIAFSLKAIRGRAAMISRQRRAADALQRHDKPTIPSEVHFAPILNIPTEILIEIFKEVRSIHEKDSQSQESPLPAAVLLSHVTRHWREISLGTPSMWTTIAVYR